MAALPSESAADSFDAVVVGAGLAGLSMRHRPRALGLSARVYDVGGPWYWNRYPAGAATPRA